MSTVFRVEKNANYTVMANYHLKDRRLSYKAKGLLSEMLSLPPDWDYTLSGLAVIAADGLDSVRSAIRELELYGYLVRSQSRDERGRMSVNEFIVYENPADNPAHIPDENIGKSDVENPVENVSNGSAKGNVPSLGNPVTVRKSDKKQNFLRKPPLEKSSPTKPLSENPTTATYNKLNKQELNTNQSNHSINQRLNCRKAANLARIEDRIDRTDFSKENEFSVREREYYRAVIREHIEYDFLVQNQNNPLLKVNLVKVDEIVSVMVDVVCSKRETIRVNGEELPQEVVKKRFLELDGEHIDYVITAFEKSACNVRNIRAYLITALYNAPETIDSYYEAMVKRDMYGK